jgi:hypothetical protein
LLPFQPGDPRRLAFEVVAIDVTPRRRLGSSASDGPGRNAWSPAFGQLQSNLTADRSGGDFLAAQGHKPRRQKASRRLAGRGSSPPTKSAMAARIKKPIGTARPKRLPARAGSAETKRRSRAVPQAQWNCAFPRPTMAGGRAPRNRTEDYEIGRGTGRRSLRAVSANCARRRRIAIRSASSGWRPRSISRASMTKSPPGERIGVPPLFSPSA